MECMRSLRLSATERLKQLRDVVAAHERAPSRRTGHQEERSLGEQVAKHTNPEGPTGDAVRGLPDNEKRATPATQLEDHQKLCTKHMRPRCRGRTCSGSRRSPP